MKKSQCYRACRDKNKEIIFCLTDSFLEVITDDQGNSFRIHFHRIGDAWSATEETTGARCVPCIYYTRRECFDDAYRIRGEYKRLLSTKSCIDLMERLKKFKEKQNEKS